MKKSLALFIFFINFIIHAHDKWIVITTINYPTKALKKLAQLPDWRMVVVADKKTPKDWHLNGCDFLSLEEQDKLDFAIIKLLPWNHYSRKNIGYLYAIAHGARIIYETDDDNYLIGNDINFLPCYTKNIALASNATTVNLYAHFGQPSVWPRGYPLQQIFEQTIPIGNSDNNYCIPIQQGLVNGDPDVDAIFRLTRKGEIYFDTDKQPLILDKNCFCPFNSQNTLFHYEAFWGLLIPITVSFRVSDIWRSYWVQRLLWDINAYLCFVAPTAHQYRNEHNLLKDFIDEYDLYVDTQRFIEFLNSWQSQEQTLPSKMLELMQTLVQQEFFKSDDYALMQAWINDLKKCGYQFDNLIV